jgi:lysophospholipase L1-like esterase
MPGTSRGPRQRWVATWGRTPSTPSLDEVIPGSSAPAAPVFTDRTLRQIAHASVGGDALRVRLSNAFGRDALVVGAARAALRASGADLAPGTDRALTFGGRPSVSIPPGALVVSDPVELRLPPLGDLAVSVHLPRPTPGDTAHASGTDTGYVLGGDQTGVERPAVASTTLALFFLTGVEVLAPPDVGLVVCLGDSITDGAGSTPDAHRAWPDRLAARLVAASRRGGQALAVVNQGYGGNRLLRDRCAHSALARFDRDVIDQPGVTDVIVLEGLNDIAIPLFGRPEEHVTAEDLVAGHRQLVARARGAGLRIHGATLTPFRGCEAWTPAGEAKRQAVNEFLRRSGELDSVVDLDAAVRDGADPARLLPGHDSGDHLHPSDAGHEALAGAVDLRVFR